MELFLGIYVCAGALIRAAHRIAGRCEPSCQVLVELVREAPTGAVPAPDLGWRGVDSYVGRFDAFVREALHEREERGCVLVVSRQQHRVEELAAEHGAETVDATDFAAASTPLPEGAIVVASADLTQGFAVADGSVHVYTDAELFGAVKRRRSVLARGSRRAVSTSAALIVKV